MTVNVRLSKVCQCCGKDYPPRSNRQMYCDDCAGTTKRDRKNMKHYGVTVAQFNKAQEEAGGFCPLCGIADQPEEQHHKLTLDHDHKTKVFRGMLCRTCNMGMGFIDNDAWLEKALAWKSRGRG